MIQLNLMKTNNWLKENGYSIEEERQIYKDCLQDVYNNPRWYLDNEDKLVEFRVSFINYRPKKQ